MLWRLAVAVVALTGVLGGSTILVAQVERDINTSFGAGWNEIPSLAPTPPEGVNPLSFDGATLPPGTKIDIPPGTKLNPDGSLTLPDGTKVPLDGAAFKDVNLDVPSDAALSIPEGTTFDGSKLTFPEGTDPELAIPGIGGYNIPGGTELELPPDVAQRLTENGYSGTNLPPEVLIPAGSTLNMPQVTGGSDQVFEALEGTRLVPPPGQSFQLPAQGGQLAVPEGTSMEQPGNLAVLAAAGVAYYALSNGYGAEDLPLELPENESSGVTQAVSVYVFSESALEKGQAFFAAGYVRNSANQGLPDVTVDVYINETPTTPGKRLGTTSTGSDGTFRVQLTAPTDLVAGRDYVLMANSQPTRFEGVAYGGAWG